MWKKKNRLYKMTPMELNYEELWVHLKLSWGNGNKVSKNLAVKAGIMPSRALNYAASLWADAATRLPKKRGALLPSDIKVFFKEKKCTWLKTMVLNKYTERKQKVSKLLLCIFSYWKIVEMLKTCKQIINFERNFRWEVERTFDGTKIPLWYCKSA